MSAAPGTHEQYSQAGGGVKKVDFPQEEEEGQAVVFAGCATLLLILAVNLHLDIEVVNQRRACGGQGAARASIAALCTGTAFVLSTWILYKRATDCMLWNGIMLVFLVLTLSALASAGIAGTDPDCTFGD